jgi:outer membrane lipopolysaccharide assembly protein LptE/RlpB
VNAESLILEVADVGIHLYLKGGSLAIKAPKGALTPELRERLKQNKSAVIAPENTFIV